MKKQFLLYGSFLCLGLTFGDLSAMEGTNPTLKEVMQNKLNQSGGDISERETQREVNKAGLQYLDRHSKGPTEDEPELEEEIYDLPQDLKT